jgi:hypothetical protein
MIREWSDRCASKVAEAPYHVTAGATGVYSCASNVAQFGIHLPMVRRIVRASMQQREN